jgi:hypothetical protein
MMSRVNLTIRCEALFVSNVQSSEHPQPPQIRTAIKDTIRRFGAHGCAALVAQEFGDHPETAVTRMCWARDAVSLAFAETAQTRSDTVQTHLVQLTSVPRAN